jgi:hypothetical protein
MCWEVCNLLLFSWQPARALFSWQPARAKLAQSQIGFDSWVPDASPSSVSCAPIHKSGVCSTFTHSFSVCLLFLQNTYNQQVGQTAGLYFRNFDPSSPAEQYKMLKALDLVVSDHMFNASNTAFLVRLLQAKRACMCWDASRVESDPHVHT